MENQPIRKAKPFIKWAGGKRQLLPELLKYVPDEFNNYFEPFLGGGALFWEVGHRAKGSAFLSDMNEVLTITYRVVKEDVEKLITILEVMDGLHTEAFFKSVRATFPGKIHRFLDIAAHFIYLNKTCFNGLYRVNKKGEFNVPFGSRKNVTICDADNLQLCSEKLKGANITFRDFELALGEAHCGDFVYLDPPYLPTSKTSNFTSFTKDGFSLADHERMIRTMSHLRNNGVKVLMSNSATAEILQLCSDYNLEVKEVQARRNINSVGDLRGKVSEILVFNWDLKDSQMNLLLA